MRSFSLSLPSDLEVDNWLSHPVSFRCAPARRRLSFQPIPKTTARRRTHRPPGNPPPALVSRTARRVVRARWLSWSWARSCATSANATPPSGWRPTTRVRWRCWATPSRPSASTDTTTRWSASRGSSRARDPSTRSAWTASAGGRWRTPNFPPARSAPSIPSGPLRVSFGSCRVALPMEPPYVFTKDEHDDGAEVDALHVYAHELIRDPDKRWPDLLLMLGDQVYVDEGSPETREFIRSRRDVSEPPGEEVLDFEEYTRLYRESWSEPYVRWLLLDRSDRDGDRRSRHQRRLEHLPLLEGGDGPQALVAPAGGGGLHDLLDLPAPGQPVPETRCPRTRPTPGSGSRATTPGLCFATTRGAPTRIARGSAGATAATSAARA